MFLKNVNHRIQQELVNCHKKWKNDLELSVEDWHDIYSLLFCITYKTSHLNLI
jgi:hypothetical protein